MNAAKAEILYVESSRKPPEARDQGLPARDRSSWTKITKNALFQALHTLQDESVSRGPKRPSVPLKARGGGGNSGTTAPLRFKYS